MTLGLLEDEEDEEDDGEDEQEEEGEELAPPTETDRVFLAAPSSTLRHRSAKLSEQSVSPSLYRTGLTVTNIKTRAWREREV